MSCVQKLCRYEPFDPQPKAKNPFARNTKDPKKISEYFIKRGPSSQIDHLEKRLDTVSESDHEDMNVDQRFQS